MCNSTNGRQFDQFPAGEGTWRVHPSEPLGIRTQVRGTDGPEPQMAMGNSTPWETPGSDMTQIWLKYEPLWTTVVLQDVCMDWILESLNHSWWPSTCTRYTLKKASSRKVGILKLRIWRCKIRELNGKSKELSVICEQFFWSFWKFLEPALFAPIVSRVVSPTEFELGHPIMARTGAGRSGNAWRRKWSMQSCSNRSRPQSRNDQVVLTFGNVKRRLRDVGISHRIEMKSVHACSCHDLYWYGLF